MSEHAAVGARLDEASGQGTRMAGGAVRTSPRALTRLRWCFAAAALLWIVAATVEWVGSPPAASPQTRLAHGLHLVADVVFVAALWTLARAQRPVRQRGELVETLLVLLGVAVPTWLLWVRPVVAGTELVTAGGEAVLAAHLALVLVQAGLVVWYVVGDVWLDRQSEAVRAVLVVMVLIDLGPPFPGGPDPAPVLVVLEVVRLAGAVGLAALAVVSPEVAVPRPTGRRHWQPDRLRLVTWAAVTLVGPVVLAGGVMAGIQDLHVIAVAVGATIVGVALLSLREWTLLQDVGNQAGRQLRRAERHASLSRRVAAREDARTAFLRAASHDLRTPLMAVRGSVELLVSRDEDLDPARRRMLLATLDRNTERLERMLLSLLDVERLTAGTVQARRATVDVAEIAIAIAALPHLRDEPIEVRPEHLEAMVDRLMVERIIENLVSNAVRHTPPGTPVRVDLRPRADGGVDLTVSDEGPGIPAQDRARVFEAFTRLDPDGEAEGSGLGLSLVSRFAALHDGAVRVGERPGGGARFDVELPGQGRDHGEDGDDVPPLEDHELTEGPPLREGLASRLETVFATSVDDEQVVDRAVRTMLHADSVEEVVGILERVVRYLGGVPVRLADGQEDVPRGLDLALGMGPPIVPAAAPGGDARRRLGPVLPDLVDDAHRIGSMLRGTPGGPMEVPDELLADPLRLRDHFLDLAVRGHVAACIDLTVALARRGEIALACDALLRPVQEESGRRWQAGTWSVAEEHLVTGIVDEVIGALELEMSRERHGGRIAIVCTPEERHATPARLAALAWRCHGWEVMYLGAGLPAASLREHLRDGVVDVLAVSCTASWHLPAVTELARIAREGGVPALAGGAGFGATAQRATRLGAAGWAPGALAAVPMLEQWRTDRPDPAPAVPVHPEADLLARRRARVRDRVVAAVERSVASWGVELAVLRTDVGVLVRSTEAALQVDDGHLLGDVVTWMRDVSATRGLPAAWPGLALEAIVEALPGELPMARRFLAGALRDRPTPGPVPADGEPGPAGASE